MRRAAVAVLFTVVCVYTTFAIVRALVWIADGHHSGRYFWPGIVLLAIVGAGAGRAAVRRWRRFAVEQRASRG
jgi:hypothetical protein